MATRILIAEDDRKQADLLDRFLARQGHVTAIVHDGRSAIDEARRHRPDLLLLDLSLPRVDGLDVCRVLRSEMDLAIIMLTARSSQDDILLGLDMGADDYLTKPYSPREVVARVRAVMRRAHPAPMGEEPCLRVGRLVVDTGRHEVRVDGRRVETTPAEFNILACLMSAPGRVFTRRHLLEQASGFGHDATGRTIDVHVMNLRRKIEPTSTRPEYLLTVYGIGYKFADNAS